jgi:hypothetical protein
LIGSGIMVVWLLGCAATIPPQFADQVAWHLSFRDIRRHPEALTGRMVVLGGIVTQIETEEVPLLAARYIRVWGPSWWPWLQIGIWGSTGL